MAKILFYFLFAILIYCLIWFWWFIGIYTVDGSSMRPTMTDGSSYFVFNNHYKQNPIERGDIVILERGGEEWIKRVVAVEGDTIEIKRGILLLNGKEKTSATETSLNIYKEQLNKDFEYQILNTSKDGYDDFMRQLSIPKNSVFVLGDHRENSSDSRTFGPVPKHEILHKVIPHEHFLYNFTFLFRDW